MDNKNEEPKTPEHIIISGKTIDHPLTIDGGKFCGNTVVGGGHVTILSQASFMSDCTISSGGIVDMKEGMILDCNVLAGGKLTIGDHAVYNNIIITSGGEVTCKSRDGLLAGEGAIVHELEPVTMPEEPAVKPEHADESHLFRFYVRTGLTTKFLNGLRHLVFQDVKDHNAGYRLDINNINFEELDDDGEMLIRCYGSLWSDKDQAYIDPDFIHGIGTYLKLVNIDIQDKYGNSINENDYPDFIEAEEVWFDHVQIPWIGGKVDQCDLWTMCLHITTSEKKKFIENLQSIDLVDRDEKYQYLITGIKEILNENDALILQLRGQLYDKDDNAIGVRYIADDEADFSLVKFNLKEDVSFLLRQLVLKTGARATGIRLRWASREIIDEIINKIDEEDHDSDMDDMLEEDSKNAQFTEGACGCHHDEEEHGDNMLVDNKGRTRLYIEGRCNYEDVLSKIMFFEFYYEGHCFYLDPSDLDDCFDDEDGERVRLYIRHLPRFKNVEDYDLVLTDVAFRDDTPDDLYFKIGLVEWEDAIIDVELNQDHDPHVFEDDELDDPPTSEIVLQGELRGKVLLNWSEGVLVITRHGKEYKVYPTDKEDGQSSHLEVQTMAFTIKIHPSHLYCIDGTVVDGEDMLPILHDCSMTYWHTNDYSSVLHFTECNIDGLDIPIEIPAQDLTIKIEGYAHEFKDIIDSLRVQTFYENYGIVTVVDKKDERIVEFDKSTHMFYIVMKPQFILMSKHAGEKEIIIAGNDMVKALTASTLCYIRTVDGADKANAMEISGYFVNDVRNSPLVFSYPVNELAKVFKYPVGEAEVEQKKLDVKSELQQAKAKEKLDVLLSGQYKYFVPALKVVLEVQDTMHKKVRYTMWAEHTDVEYGEDDNVCIMFSHVVFVEEGKTDGKRIVSPDDLDRTLFSFIVETHQNTMGEFKPNHLVFGNVEYEWD